VKNVDNIFDKRSPGAPLRKISIIMNVGSMKLEKHVLLHNIAPTGRKDVPISVIHLRKVVARRKEKV